MNQGLLRRYVREIVQEAIRTKPGVEGKFNWKEFKALEYNDDMVEYAKKYLDEVGKGSSRDVFVFSGSKVLKIAKNDAGIAQNETEVYLSEISKGKGVSVVTNILQHDPEFRWTLAQISRAGSKEKPIESTQKFAELAGIDWDTFRQIVEGRRGVDEIDMSPPTKALIEIVLELIDRDQLMPGDVLKLDSWGVTGDGKIVLLDFGLTADVKQRHYRRDEETGKLTPIDKRGQRERKQQEDTVAQAVKDMQKKREEEEAARKSAASSPGAPKYKYVSSSS